MYSVSGLVLLLKFFKALSQLAVVLVYIIRDSAGLPFAGRKILSVLARKSFIFELMFYVKERRGDAVVEGD